MKNPLDVWVVDDDQSIRWVMQKSLSRAGMNVQVFEGAAELFDAIEEGLPDVLITDIRMPGVNGLDLMERVHKKHPDLPVIVMTAHSDLDAAVASYKGGAFEYLAKPFDVDNVAELVARAASKRAPVEQPQNPGDTGMIGEAPAMQEVFRAIGRLSQSQITVMVTGESGTGKELVARALHVNSPRASKPFIAINTAAIPKDLMESEFFGHERGSFTGAQTQRKGRFEQADGGTLFLDEIGDMPADLQTRLLRVLQNGEFYRVGGVAPIKADVRVIAATHQDLENSVVQGRFREDLYHRLNVIRVRIPSLKERSDDIPLLMRHFLAHAAQELQTECKHALPEVMEVLRGYSWPGNVRQLENVCRWLTVMAPGQDIHVTDLPPEIAETIGSAKSEIKTGGAPGFEHAATREENPESPPGDEPSIDAGEQPLEPSNTTVIGLRSGEKSDAGNLEPPTQPWDQVLSLWADAQFEEGKGKLLDEALPRFEATMIRSALRATQGQRQEAAKRLGWGRNTLTRKIQDLKLDL